MKTSPKTILMIEDNKADQLLVCEYIQQKFPLTGLLITETCEEALGYLQKKENKFDLILLDLSLPDKGGEELFQEIINVKTDIPIIILTGYIDMEFSIKLITMGASDYLLKDTLTSASLYKSITHSIERRNISRQLLKSNERYEDLFHLSPQPIFVVAIKDFSILDVNEAVILKYGCSKKVFLEMNMQEIQEGFDSKLVDHLINDQDPQTAINYTHSFEDKVIKVGLQANLINFKGEKSLLLLVNDITDTIQYIDKIKSQNKKITDIAWQQSHMVRAPLTRLMGLVDVFEMQQKKASVQLPEELQYLLKNILSSAHEIDKVVKDIVKNTYNKSEK